MQYLQKEKGEMDTLLAAYKELIDEEESGFYNNAMNLWTQYREADDEILGSQLVEISSVISFIRPIR